MSMLDHGTYSDVFEKARGVLYTSPTLPTGADLETFLGNLWGKQVLPKLKAYGNLAVGDAGPLTEFFARDLYSNNAEGNMHKIIEKASKFELTEMMQLLWEDMKNGSIDLKKAGLFATSALAGGGLAVALGKNFSSLGGTWMGWGALAIMGIAITGGVHMLAKDVLNLPSVGDPKLAEAERRTIEEYANNRNYSHWAELGMDSPP